MSDTKLQRTHLETRVPNPSALVNATTTFWLKTNESATLIYIVGVAFIPFIDETGWT
jgi:hypothetical protein